MTRRPRLAVYGDVLLDRDVCGTAERFSPDGPVPVVEARAARARPGGAGLAALLAARRADVVLVAPIGEDDAGEELRRLLEDAGVDVVACPTAEPTGVKSRVRVGDHTVVRIDEGGGSTRPAILVPEALAAAADADAILVADYGRGFTAHVGLRDLLGDELRRTPVVWDPHLGGSVPVRGVRLATPNAAEAARLAGLAPFAGGFARHAAAGAALAREWESAAVVVTLGSQGAMLVEGPGPPLVVPAVAVAGGDTCGAGDCFASTAAIALGDGAVVSEAVVAGVEAAGAYVAAGGASGLRDQARAQPVDAGGTRRTVREQGGTVVATGGCFDLLHAGHVSLLESARALGDCLVVCLNGDDSVRRLKGPGRPVVSASDRIAVLRSLSCVDEVVVFDEDTPERVLEGIRPDVFVKGGDYAHTDLPEVALLAGWGGQVVVVPYLPGRSTTRMIEEAASGVA